VDVPNLVAAIFVIMNKHNLHVVVIGGPNGAGKSNAASRLLRGPLAVQEFVDADVIARGLSAFNPNAVAIESGRVMLRRLAVLAGQGVSFAFETTLSSRSFAPWLVGLRAQGYRVDVLFLWLPRADLAVARVHDRVNSGGHYVPEETVRRRYERGLFNSFRIYRQVTTSWRLYNNSNRAGPMLIARGGGESVHRVRDRALWALIERTAQHG
jgi:predicted ABC-type ATPase